jgi:hypothetical protein
MATMPLTLILLLGLIVSRCQCQHMHGQLQDLRTHRAELKSLDSNQSISRMRYKYATRVCQKSNVKYVFVHNLLGYVGA